MEVFLNTDINGHLEALPQSHISNLLSIPSCEWCSGAVASLSLKVNGEWFEFGSDKYRGNMVKLLRVLLKKSPKYSKKKKNYTFSAIRGVGGWGGTKIKYVDIELWNLTCYKLMIYLEKDLKMFALHSLVKGSII